MALLGFQVQLAQLSGRIVTALCARRKVFARSVLRMPITFPLNPLEISVSLDVTSEHRQTLTQDGTYGFQFST